MKKLQNFINGKSVDSASGEVTTLINPATAQPFATAPKSNAADVDKAMKAAEKAFEVWKESTPGERQKAINKIADAIEARSEELIQIESENTGKPIAVTRAEEIGPMLDQIRFFAGAARHLEGRSAAEYFKGHTSFIRREPIGVCAQVTLELPNDEGGMEMGTCYCSRQHGRTQAKRYHSSLNSLDGRVDARVLT